MAKRRVKRSIDHDGVEIAPAMDGPQTPSSTGLANGHAHSTQRKEKTGSAPDRDRYLCDRTVPQQLASFEVGQAVIGTVISQPRGGLIDIITYSDGIFTLTVWSRALRRQGTLRQAVLRPPELAALLDALQDQIDHPPADRHLDLVALRAFTEVLAQNVEPSASNRFEGARFAGISRDAGGGIVAHLGLGIDTAGTVHDTAGRVTFSCHVIPLPPGPFQPLPPLDLDCLVASLITYLDDTPLADPLWRELLNDLRKGKGTVKGSDAPDLLDVDQAAGSAAHSVPRAIAG